MLLIFTYAVMLKIEIKIKKELEHGIVFIQVNLHLIVTSQVAKHGKIKEKQTVVFALQIVF
jgi:hypothetical protein